MMITGEAKMLSDAKQGNAQKSFQSKFDKWVHRWLQMHHHIGDCREKMYTKKPASQYTLCHWSI